MIVWYYQITILLVELKKQLYLYLNVNWLLSLSYLLKRDVEMEFRYRFL